MNQLSLTYSLSLSFSLLRQVMECGLSLLLHLLPSFPLVYAWSQPVALSQAWLGWVGMFAVSGGLSPDFDLSRTPKPARKQQRMTHNHIHPFTKAIITSFWTTDLSRSADSFRFFIQTNQAISRSTQGLHPHNSRNFSMCNYLIFWPTDFALSFPVRI